MGLLSKITTTLTVSTTALITLFSTPGLAFTVTQNSQITDLLNALLGTTSGLSNFQLSIEGNNQAFGLFSDAPFAFSSGLVLSTGQVVDLPGENTVDGGVQVIDPKNVPQDLSTDFPPTAKGSAGQPGDAIQMTITFDADSTAETLFFQYVFGSEEFREFGGSSYNDSFQLLLNGTNLAKLSDGQTVTINHLIPNPLDSSSYHPDYINNLAGPGTLTKLDGYTKVLGFAGTLNKNATNTLTIQIADVGDGYLDSAVFIKGKSLGTVPPWGQRPPSQPIPEPNPLVGLFGIGVLGVISQMQRR